MRLTPAQIGVRLICGGQLRFRCQHDSLAAGIRAGREMLVKLTGEDFGYDLAAWHAHLKESREGGYTWARTVVLPNVMKEALASEEWRRTVQELAAGSP